MSIKKSEQEVLKQSRLFVCNKCNHECTLIGRDTGLVFNPGYCPDGHENLCEWTELEGK